MQDSSGIAFQSPGILQLPVQKVSADSSERITDPVAIEQPLEIRILSGSAPDRREQSLSITMRTPGNDQELALGWLFTEGILPAECLGDVHIGDSGLSASPSRIVIGPSTANTIILTIPDSITPDLTRSQRHSYTSSSCGVCGKTSLEKLHLPVPAREVQNGLAIPSTLVYTLPAILREAQDIFDATGGLHAAGLFDREGRLVAIREDIGRHNALDKLIGHSLLQQRIPLFDNILLLSGRACFELIQKAAIAGIRIVAAVGPPSSLAVDLARESGITLIGFLRQHRFNIYSNAHRIQF